MSKSWFFIFAVYVGLQSFLLQLIDQLIGTQLVIGGIKGFVFIAFQSWALYFLLGSTVKGGLKGFAGYFMGIVFAVIMLKMGMAVVDLGIFAVPMTALIVVPIMMYFEYAPFYISDVAVFFIGAGAFFGIYNYVEGIGIIQASVVEMLYCILGLVSGWMTVLFRNWYEKKVTLQGTLAKEENR